MHKVVWFVKFRADGDRAELDRRWATDHAALCVKVPGVVRYVQNPVVTTATLEMVLHHDSGRMTGRVTRGAYAGADLGDLDLPALRSLLADCAAQDPESVPLLEAWLDRTEPDWRSAPGEAPPPAEGPLTRTEALAILGLAEGATAEEVRAAHRRLMRTAHPDHGGSAWLAARLNAARDLLLST